MPCIIKVRILAGRNLPIMDRASESTDAYVELKFGEYEVQRTPICRKSLNPVWNQDFRFECADDADAQNEPLEMRVMDYDAISYNDIIGLVFVDLNPLLADDSSENASSELTGWFPMVDTIRGIRGELSVHVKVQFFDDINPFKESSTGVQFFSLPCVPDGRQVTALIGFAEALISEDDPEYHWTDNFRTPRTSNEARMRCMYRLGGQLRRQFGKKVMEMGANAVIGFKQFFDLESEERIITARAIGTAVKLCSNSALTVTEGPSLADAKLCTSPMQASFKQSLKSVNGSFAEASLPPEGNGSSTFAPVVSGAFVPNQVQLITASKLPQFSVRHLGGLIMAVSVKVIQTDRENEREMWWSDLRDEIKGHAKVLNCNFVIGYSERLTIIDDVCILMSQGTACVLDLKMLYEPVSALPELARGLQVETAKCEFAHIPFLHENAPFPMSFVRCEQCRRKHVPEFIFSTTEVPQEAELVTSGILVEAHVCRTYKTKDSETVATVLSEAIPFIQYDLLRQLLYKLRLYTLNAVFGLKFQIKLGESFLIALATGTAVFIKALPVPVPIRIQSNAEVLSGESVLYRDLEERLMLLSQSHYESRTAELAIAKEEEALQATAGDSNSDSESEESVARFTEDMVGQMNASGAKSKLVFLSKAKDSHPSSFVVLQIDDTADEDLVGVLLDGGLCCGLELVNIETKLSAVDTAVETQMITVYKRATIMPNNHPNQQLSALFQHLYKDLSLHLSYFSRCVLSDISYDVQLLEDEEVHIRLTATAVGSIDDTDPSAETLGVVKRQEFTTLPEFWTLLDLGGTNQSPTALFNSMHSPKSGARSSRYNLFKRLADASTPANKDNWLKSVFGQLKSSLTPNVPRIKLRKGSRANATSKALSSHSYPSHLVSALSSEWPVPLSQTRCEPSERDPDAMADSQGNASGEHSPSKLGYRKTESVEDGGKSCNEVPDDEAVSLLKIPDRLLSAFEQVSDNGRPGVPKGVNNGLVSQPGALSGLDEYLEHKSDLKSSVDRVFVNSPTAYYNNCAPAVEITTLAHVPGASVERYLGRISLHIVREGALYPSETFATFSSESETRVCFDYKNSSLSVTSPMGAEYSQLLADALNIQDKLFSMAGVTSSGHDHRAIERTGSSGSIQSVKQANQSPNNLSEKVYLDVEELKAKDRQEIDGVNTLSTGGLAQFCQTVFSELNAMVRAQVAAIGGNALIGFAVEQCFIEEAFKNQGYAFCSISGDVVELKRAPQDTTSLLDGKPLSAPTALPSGDGGEPVADYSFQSLGEKRLGNFGGSYNVDISSKRVHLTRDCGLAFGTVSTASPLSAQVQKMEYLPPPVTPKPTSITGHQQHQNHGSNVAYTCATTNSLYSPTASPSGATFNSTGPSGGVGGTTPLSLTAALANLALPFSHGANSAAGHHSGSQAAQSHSNVPRKSSPFAHTRIQNSGAAGGPSGSAAAVIGGSHHGAPHHLHAMHQMSMAGAGVPMARSGTGGGLGSSMSAPSRHSGASVSSASSTESAKHTKQLSAKARGEPIKKPKSGLSTLPVVNAPPSLGCDEKLASSGAASRSANASGSVVKSAINPMLSSVKTS